MATKTYNIDINVQSKTLGQLETQLAEVNEELKQVDRNSEAFKNLTTQAQALNKEINKTNKEIEGFTMEKKIDAANGAAMVFSGTLNTVVGSLGLLGIESEKFGEFEKKAASAIAAGIGIKDMTEGLSKVGPAFASAGKAAVAFGRTTKGALIATGVGAFVVIVGTLVANWDAVTKAIKKFGESVPLVGQALTFLTKAFDKVKKSLKGVTEALGITMTDEEKFQQSQRESLEQDIRIANEKLAIRTAEKASLRELYNLKKSILEQEIALLKDQEDKEEEFLAKRTELRVLEAAERTRLHEEEMLRRQEEMASMDEISTITAQKATSDVEITSMAAADINNILTNKLAKDKATSDASVAISDAEQEEKRKNLMLTGIALETLSNIAGQETQAGKALASAGALINTYLAASDALKSVPFPFNFVAAAAVVANGLATVKRINETEVPGESGGSMASASPTSFVAPNTQDLQAAQSVAPQIAPATPMVQAYVVAGDTRSADEAEAKIQTRRTFGS